MRRMRIETADGAWLADLDEPHDLAIPLAFDGEQPNLFSAPRAGREALRSGDFVGDVTLGGSCNCSTYSLTPHCNGTHTECIGHVTRQRVHVADVYRGGLEMALVLSVPAVTAEACSEDTDPFPRPEDFLITAEALAAAWERWRGVRCGALVVRSLPNRDTKRAHRYEEGCAAPYLTRQAVELIVAHGVQHLLLDLPSLDRAHDGGKLTGHRLFWGLPPGSTDVIAAKRAEATITELIFVPNDVPDGPYVLDLQIAPFLADAAPSRPILYPVIE